MKIKKVKINNRKKCIDIETRKGPYSLPFSKLELQPSAKNKIAKIYIDKELASECVTYILESGKEDAVPLCAFLDYNRDPEYVRDMTLYKLTVEAITLLKKSGLSKQEVIRRLKTSPSQLYRLLDTTNYKKSIDEMLKLLSVLGYTVELKILKAAA